MPNLFDDLVIEKTTTVENENFEDYEKQYAVFLHNDDITPMEFVVIVLTEIFGKTPGEALKLTLQIHHSDKGVAGIYDKETAYAKVDELDKLKQACGIHLLATVEENE
jgi:ATP-dependent Clp protease adaptor protein ClpS